MELKRKVGYGTKKTVGKAERARFLDHRERRVRPG
jgi:hypothetical protein